LSVIAIIPARMGSKRFPGKPLKKISGLSMIEHVRRRTLLSNKIDEVLVATCDQEIIDEVTRFGGKAVLTSKRHNSCVDRVAEAASSLNVDVIINVQGDFPLVNPKSLEKLVEPLLKDKTVNFTDMMTKITNKLEILNHNIVKVVVSLSDKAMYYCRGPIPSSKKEPKINNIYYKQLGINAYRKESLIKFSKLKRTYLEKIESIDMLRLLENDIAITMVNYNTSALGVDTPNDLKKVRKLMEIDDLFLKYS
jgi:3-deoxy-manno-octulosonate cytidylyltransferase (CMP-KDO synthetase)